MIALVVSLGALAFAGLRVARAAGATDASRATRAVRAVIAAFALLIVVEAALGAGGRLDATSTALALILVAVALGVGTRRHRTPAPETRNRPPEPLTIADAALAAAITAALALRLWAGLHKTTFLYDTLSYHLHTPATWIADRRLRIVPAVFGDPSAAYAPANVELWLAFLMAPLHSDYLAGTGQLPLAALAALAIVASVREAGGQRAPALAAALAFLLVPEIWQQARTAMTDLGMAAFLLAALPFVFRLRRAIATGDLLTCAAALGLAVGTKYAGPILAAPFAIVAAFTVGRAKPDGARKRQLAAAAAVILVTGGFWYLRNAILTGNPFYPVATLGLPGLYDRATMRAWDYHLPTGELSALGSMLLDGGIGFLLAAVIAGWRATAPVTTGLTIALVVLFWCVVPYQESRFLFAAFGTAAVTLGLAARAAPTALGWAGLSVAIGGALFEFPSPDRWAILPAGALGAVAALAGRRVPPRARRTAVAAGAIGLLAGGTALLALGLDRYRTRDPHYAVGTELDAAWAWFRANVSGARVAYTGTNLGFPLTGRDLANRVGYVNVAGAPGDRLDDFGRRAPAHGLAPTPEPAPYRDGASFETWLRNLRADGTEVLFVAALDPMVARNVAADGDGFPIERAWADAHPALFHLRYSSPAARVYRLVPP